MAKYGSTKQQLKMACIWLLLLLLMLFACYSVNANTSEEAKFAPVVIAVTDENTEGHFDKWTKAHYNVLDQCHAQAGIREEYLRSHRLHFQCAPNTVGDDDCGDAKLLVCYPSMLDPKAVPEEGTDYDRTEMTPVSRAPFSNWITNEAENENIAANCTELMNICQNEQDCPMPTMAREEGEEWHGFLITRENGKFVIKLPFGNDGKSFHINDTIDSDDGGGEIKEFFINFGNEENPEMTYVVRGPRSDDNRHSMNGGKFYKQYKQEQHLGIPMNAAKHLWVLGLDLLPTFERQEIRFFTRAFPNKVKESECEKKATGGLESKDKWIPQFIEAIFLDPSNSDDVKIPRQQSRSNDKKNGGVEAKRIEIAQGKPVFQKLTNYLPNTEFYISGYVPKKAVKFEMTLAQGMADNMDEPVEGLLGETILKIIVHFAEGKEYKQPTICGVQFLQSEKRQELCTNGGKNGFIKGRQFLLWIQIKDGNVSVNINCYQLIPFTFTWKEPHYAEFKSIKFESIEGSIEIDEIESGTEKSLADEQDIGSNMTGKPTLNVLKIPGEFDVDTILLFNGKFIEKIEKSEIRLVATKAKEAGKLSLQIEVLRKNCLAVVPGCKCYLEFSYNSQPIGKALCPAKNNYNIILYYQSNVLSEGISIFSDGKQISEIKLMQGNNVADANFVQAKGGIEIPLKLKHLTNYGVDKTIMKGRIDDELNKMRDTQSLIINVLRLDQKNPVDDKITIKFGCSGTVCYGNEFIEEKKMSLIIEMDRQKISASSYQAEKQKSIVVVDLIEQPFTFGMGTPFWLKINVDKTSQKYQIFVNGRNFMEIDCSTKDGDSADSNSVDVDEFSIEGNNLLILNKPIIMPYQYILPEKVEKGDKIVISGRFLENIQFFELFLIKKGERISTVLRPFIFGTNDEQQQFIDDKGAVILHLRADNSSIKGEDWDYPYVCINTIYKPGKRLCKMKARITKAIEGNSHKLTLEFKSNDKIISTIDELPQSYLEIDAISPLQATHLVINGDIALDTMPELIKAPNPTTPITTVEAP